MFKAFIVPILVILVLTPIVSGEIDVSPYSDLLAEITQKEAEQEAARVQSDWDKFMAIGREIESLKKQEADPQMRFLKKYSNLQLPLEESSYLIEQMVAILEGDAIASASSDFDSISQTFSEAESAYTSQDYGNAVSSIESIENSLINLPSSLASTSSESVTALKSDMERTSQVTQSTLSMLDDAKKRFQDAQEIYSGASDKILRGNINEASVAMQDGRTLTSSAFDLVSRAKERGGTLLDTIKLLLILGPLALIIALLAYFYMQFKRAVISCSISKNTAPGEQESEIERSISVTNLEKVPVSMRVFDAPPRALGVSNFNTNPTKSSGNDLVWDFELQPGKGMDISYKLRVPKLAAGWILRVHAASASYTENGMEKKFVGKSATIKIV